MSKGLDAFENIFDFLKSECVEEGFVDDYDIVAKELKDKEDYDNLLKDFNVTFPQLREALVLYKTFDVEDNKKKLKTLEFIKEIDKTSLLHFIAVSVKDQKKYEFLKEELL